MRINVFKSKIHRATITDADVDYEGSGLGEPEGIRATKALLERVRTQLAAEFPTR